MALLMLLETLTIFMKTFRFIKLRTYGDILPEQTNEHASPIISSDSNKIFIAHKIIFKCFMHLMTRKKFLSNN